MRILPSRSFHLVCVSAWVLGLSACAELSPNVTSGTGDYTVTPVTAQVISQLQNSPVTSSGGSNSDEYVIGPGDVLTARLNVPGMDEYSVQRPILSGGSNEFQQTTVMDSGYASFPYAGDMKIAGKTLLVARQNLRDAMAKYFKNPQVALEVKEFNSRKVYVMGEVSKPSLQFIKASRMSVAEALSASQGMSPLSASYKQIYVIRSVVSPAAPVAAASEKTDFSKQAAAAPAANLSGMSTAIYQIDASNGTGIAMAAQFPLRANDVVYVSPTAISEWNKIITQLLPYNGSFAGNVARNW